MTEFVEWDFGTGVATWYKRMGKCNMCGDCCKAIINVTVPNDGVGRSTDDKKGQDAYTHVWNEAYPEQDRPDNMRSFVRFKATTKKTRCCSLAPGNICIDNGNKRWACQMWPTCPNDIKLFPQCSYYFEELNHWDFDSE